MLPSGATAGPSVSPPLMSAVRVNSSSSLASGETMSLPVGLGTSAARANWAAQRSVISRILIAEGSGERNETGRFYAGDEGQCKAPGLRSIGFGPERILVCMSTVEFSWDVWKRYQMALD